MSDPTLIYRFDDPDDPQRYFSRSDHYNYAQKGIPVAFLFDGMVEDYHRISDDPGKINLTKMCRVAGFMTELVVELANRETRLR